MRFASARILNTLFNYLEARGVPPRDVADAASIAFVRRCSGAERIPAMLAINILERCADRLDEPLFGLNYAQALDAKAFGPISLFWRYAPTLRYSHNVSSRIVHVHHEGVFVRLTVNENEATFVYRVDTDLRDNARQFVEANLSFALRICRWILGAGWSPIGLSFAHPPACPPERYAEILSAPVAFGAAEDALIVQTADLDRAEPGHDLELLEFVERSLLAVAERETLEFREQLSRTIEYLIAIRAPRLGTTAATMGISARTLQRRLTCEGTSFQQVLCETRRRILQEAWLSQKRPSLLRLAEQTGYSDASAVSRFIRTQSALLGRTDVRRARTFGSVSPADEPLT